MIDDLIGFGGCFLRYRTGFMGLGVLQQLLEPGDVCTRHIDPQF